MTAHDPATCADPACAACDVVPPVHASHAFPTAAERHADPMAEGCGGCAALPGDEEALEPCAPPVAFWTPERRATRAAELAPALAALLGVLAWRVEHEDDGTPVPEEEREGRWTCGEAWAATWKRDAARAAGLDLPVTAYGFVASTPRGPDGQPARWVDPLGLAKYVSTDSAPLALVGMVARLARELAWSRMLWRGLGGEAEQALAYQRQRGGQHAGAPPLAGAPVSLLRRLEREARDALGPARQDVPLAELVREAQGEGRRPAAPATETTADLFAKVRARLGPAKLGACCTVRVSLYASCGVKWHRVYADGACSDERRAEGDDMEACLRAVLAHEDAADRAEPRYAGAPATSAPTYAVAGQPCGAQPCPLRHLHDHQRARVAPPAAEPTALPDDTRNLHRRAIMAAARDGIGATTFMAGGIDRYRWPRNLEDRVRRKLGDAYDCIAYNVALVELRLTKRPWEGLRTIGPAPALLRMGTARVLVAKGFASDTNGVTTITPLGTQRLCLGRGP